MPQGVYQGDGAESWRIQEALRGEPHGVMRSRRLFHFLQKLFVILAINEKLMTC